jgi:excinuclease UvrABC nuclease subunit
MLEFDRQSAFDPASAAEFLVALPSKPAVLLIEPRAELPGARPVLLRTADLRRRLTLLLGPRDPASKRIHLGEYAAGIRYRLTGSPFEQALVQWQHARALWPHAYREKLRLRAPALVKLALANAYPRAYVTRRITGRGANNAPHLGVDFPAANPPRGGLYFGPFASRRAAEAFLVPLLDLFRMRRCQIRIRRDPEFPGCIYSEMKMCLAPCFAGCTDAEYASEVGRVHAFLLTRGASLSDELSRERESASGALDFERAAALHRRLEKVAAVRQALPEIARPIEELNAAILQRSAEKNTVAVFALRRGLTSDPFLLQFAELATRPRSAEQILREVLQTDPAAAAGIHAHNDGSTRAESEDHLALLARWFYARPRLGEIFFPDAKSDWPFRRILRACARLLAPAPAPEHPA